MIQLLISVTSIQEAHIALENGADFIDLKDPAQGALGALPLDTIAEIVSYVKVASATERKLTSATIGDLPMEPQLIFEHAERLAATGVDIIKIGFFDNSDERCPDYESCLSTLAPLAKNGLKLIAVLFSEYNYPDSLIASIKDAGFYGLMLDTAIKNGATFFDYFTEEQMKVFSENVKAHNLIFGLAGCLTLKHVAKVRQINPCYLGFRGGVCVGHQRKLMLDSVKISAIRKSLQSML